MYLFTIRIVGWFSIMDSSTSWGYD